MANIVSSVSLRADPLIYFPNFLWKSWRTIGLPDPTPLQYDFAHYLDGGYLAELEDHALKGDVGARKILMAFRGASKSYVTTDYAVCRLRRDRAQLILCVSATGGYAGAIANFAFQMVSNFDWLADMKPRSSQGHRMSSLAFDVNGCPPAVKDESFCSEGLFGQITGHRADCILGDDLETPNTSETETKRTLLRKRMGEFGAIIKPGGDIYLLGTAQTDNTVYREYADEKGYELRIYPISYPHPDPDPKKDELRKFGTRLAPFVAEPLAANPLLAGTSIEPTRFSEGDILGRRREWGQIEFQRQFLMWLEGAAGDKNPLKLRDLVVMELAAPSPSSPQLLLPSEITWAPSPQLAAPDIQLDSLSGDGLVYFPAKSDILIPAEETICFVDTSGSGEDETTWTIMAGLLGRVFVLAQGASLDGHGATTLEAIARDCKRWGVQRVEVEENFGGGMFVDLLTPKLKDIHHLECSVEAVKAGQTMKERRILDTLTPLVTDHRLVVNLEVLRQDYAVDYPEIEQAKRRFYRLTYQLTRMVAIRGALKHDDRADGLAGAARHFVGVLLRQLQNAREAGRVLAIEKEVEHMIEVRKKQGLHLFGLEKVKSVFGRGSPRKR